MNQTWPSIFLGYMLSCNPLLPFGCCLLLFGSEHKRMPEEARWPHINHILTKKLKDLTSWLLLSNPLQQRYYNVVWQNLKELGQHYTQQVKNWRRADRVGCWKKKWPLFFPSHQKHWAARKAWHVALSNIYFRRGCYALASSQNYPKSTQQL